MTPNQTMEQTTTSLAVPPSIACAPNTALIRVTGEDARHFLHGQFTQKIENLAGRTTLAGYCSPKGRLLAVLRAWLPGDAVMLALPAEMAEGFLKRLHMYVLRSKVTFEVVDPAPAMLIAVGEEGAKTLSALGLEMPAHGVCIEKNGFTLLGIEPSQTVPGFCAGGARALVILPAGKTAADFGLTPAPAAWALASSIAAGIPQVLPPTRETFVPQAVNLELVDGVSFSKGCYPGQEVVSRLQHLGETNRRAAVGLLSAEAAAPAGAPVYAKGEEVGRVVRAVTLGGRTLVLFSATIGSLLTGITLTPDGQPLELVELPYRYRNILKTSA